MVKVLERCFIDENKDNEYFSKYLKLSWNFANKYTELNKLKRDFELKKNNIITYEFNKLYYNNYNYNSSLILSNNIAVNDLSSLSADHINNVDLNNISHIEVIRGPSSIFTHGGTSGGIVNIISDIISGKKYEKDILKYDYSSVNNGYANNFLFKRNLFNTNIFFSINNKHLDNYGIPKGSKFEEGILRTPRKRSSVFSGGVNSRKFAEFKFQ